MDKLERKLRDAAIYSPKDYKEANIDKIINGFELEQKYMGQLSRVYIIKDSDWVIKESRWDLSFELYGDVRLPFPARLSETVLKRFAFNFLPKKEHILDEYGRYLTFAQYFGYFDEESDFYHPNIDLIYSSQKNTRNSLAFFRPELEKEYKFKLDLNFLSSLW